MLSHDPTGAGREWQGRYAHIYFLKRAFHTDRITWQPDIIIIIIALPRALYHWLFRREQSRDKDSIHSILPVTALRLWPPDIVHSGWTCFSLSHTHKHRYFAVLHMNWPIRYSVSGAGPLFPREKLSKAVMISINSD